MARTSIARIGLVLALGLCGAAHAAAPRTYSIEIAPKRDWRAEALAVALAHDLADDRLTLATGTGVADLVVHASIDDRALRYDARATWPGAPAPITGAIPLGRERAVVAGQL